MKKVRYAIGALGAAPAVALMMPAANAANAANATAGAAHAGKTVKFVSLTHVKGAPLATSCDVDHTHNSSSGMRGYISYDPVSGCIGFVEGHRYNSDHVSRQMRVRFYRSGTVGPASTYYRNGVIHSGNDSITYKWSPNVAVGVTMVCEAIVSDPFHGVVAGPLCQTTGF